MNLTTLNNKISSGARNSDLNMYKCRGVAFRTLPNI